MLQNAEAADFSYILKNIYYFFFSDLFSCPACNCGAEEK